MLLLINKPTGITSFDLIRKLQKIYPKEKIGHAGTLDPLATGLMIIAIGKDTKRLSKFVGLDKTYIADIDFSQTSDTRDTDYWAEHSKLDFDNKQIQSVSDNNKMLTIPSLEEINQRLQSIIGIHPLPLTPFSAKKIKGKKLYEYARAGEPIFIDIEMEVIDFNVLSYTFPQLKVELHVGSGTYIRSIAHRLGKQFDIGGILTGLHRSSIGKLKIEHGT